MNRRRRRKGNPLLAKIVGYVILFHLILLPIAAKFGVFKDIQKHYINTELVNLPPEKVKPQAKQPERKAPQKVASKGAKGRARGPQNQPHQALSHPNLIAGAPAGAGGGDGPSVNTNGTGPAGGLPNVVPSAAPKPVSVPTPAPVTTPTPAPVTIPTPTPRPPTPAPPPPHVPVYTDAEPVDEPKPTLPDTLRADSLDSTAVAEFTVDADGSPTDVRIITSAGNPDLDQLVLQAARKWRFKPATRDGQPIPSVIRLHVEFQVI
jgi:protein TonB